MNFVGAEDYLDKDSVSSISGAATDYLIAFGVAAIVPAAIASYWQALLVLFILGTIFCSFFLMWFPAEFFGERWIERGIFGWGWATATVATGIAVLKIVDPKLKSGTLSEYGMAYIGFGPFEISWTIIAPMAVMYGFTGAFGAVSLAISIGVYLTFKFMGLLPPRGRASATWARNKKPSLHKSTLRSYSAQAGLPHFWCGGPALSCRALLGLRHAQAVGCKLPASWRLSAGNSLPRWNPV